MTLHVKDAGTWKEVTDLYVKDAGSWKAVTNAYIKDGGTWKEFFTAVLNPTSVNAGADDTDHQSDTNPSGSFSLVRACIPVPTDDGSYTYLWERTSNTGTNSATPSGTTTDTLGLTATLFDGDTVIATYRVTVTSSDGLVMVQDSFNINWSYTDTGP